MGFFFSQFKQEIRQKEQKQTESLFPCILSLELGSYYKTKISLSMHFFFTAIFVSLWAFILWSPCFPSSYCFLDTSQIKLHYYFWLTYTHYIEFKILSNICRTFPVKNLKVSSLWAMGSMSSEFFIAILLRINIVSDIQNITNALNYETSCEYACRMGY